MGCCAAKPPQRIIFDAWRIAGIPPDAVRDFVAARKGNPEIVLNSRPAEQQFEVVDDTTIKSRRPPRQSKDRKQLMTNLFAEFLSPQYVQFVY